MKLKVVLFLATLVVLLVLGWRVKSCLDESPKPLPDTRPQVPVQEKPAVNRNEQSLPPKVKPKDVEGVADATITNPETGEKVKISVIIPKEGGTPTVLIDTASSWKPEFEITYTPFRDPWVLIEPNIFLGASASQNGVSPFGGVSLVTLTRFNVRAGLSADRFGGGVFGAWCFYKDTFNLHIQYNVLHWSTENIGRVSVGISLML